jgi:putative DNA primase/helicase
MRDYVGEALRGAAAEHRWKDATNGAGGFDSFDGSGGSRFSEWPEPKPLPKGLPPVASFDPDFLPDAISPWVIDITNRMQCQLDNVAVAAMTGLGAVIGRRVGIKPQMNTDWVEVPNIWGAAIGRPGLIKSGAQNAGVGPLHHLEAEAAKKNSAALQAYEAELEDYKIRQRVNRHFKKEALKGEGKQLLELGAEPTPPVDIRYRTNDTSYESLGELLIGNSNGILVERDELISLLQHLDGDDQANARGFYLSGWSGQHPYTFDRIVRGHRHIEAVCISVLGNTQPARISEYVRRANLGGAGGDGLIQRFGLLVWPDVPPEWKNVDVPPDGVARQRVWSIFEQISKIDASEALRLGATQDQFDKIPAFRFTDAAHAQFLEWREELERRLRSGELSPALEGHLSKYRKLVPALALINHLADGREGNVDVREVLRAIAYAEYLETHAQRVYSSASESETAAAQAILRRIRKGDLEDGFTARDVHRPRWSNLTEHEQVASSLNLLVDFSYLAETELGIKPQGADQRLYTASTRDYVHE